MTKQQPDKDTQYRNMNKASRQHIKLTLMAMALLLVSGTALAQNDPQFVIKKGDNYLSHVNIEGTWHLQNATSFDPATCLWYSGPNVKNNFYFMNGSDRLYLSAPLVLGSALSISSDPGTVVLNAPSNNYFFYAWDHGVARGVQHSIEDCQGETPALPNGLNPSGNQCWEVAWVSYENNAWKLSSAESYSLILEVAALQHRVTVTEHGEEISNETGGITNIVLNDFSMDYTSPHSYHELNGTASNYSFYQTPAYTSYAFEAISVNETNDNNHINPNIQFEIPEEFHYYYNGGMQPSAPSSTLHEYPSSNVSYNWTITGEGASYLSFSDSQTQSSSTLAEPKVWYRNQNTTNSHKQATLTLTVTYATGVTQTRSAIITVKTQCQNPAQASAPVVNFEGVTVSWLPTADSYTISWRKVGTTSWNSVEVGNVTSYTIRDVEGSTTYEYKVKADCSSTEPSAPYLTFTTIQQNAVILGSVFGGGRMANVKGKTDVVIVNCDSIGAVYGGNDITGKVEGNAGENGSTITLGVNNGDPNVTTYGGYTDASIGIRIGDVYGGGNGYYAYNSTSIEQAAYNTHYSMAEGSSIMAFTPSHPEGEVVWTNNTGSTTTIDPPSIPKTNIKVVNDYVKIDSLFGGAKNAILSDQTNDVNITIDGGTIYTVFGGNNFGGSLGYQSKENIIVNNTTVKTTVSEYRAKRMGRDFGIGYLFGGGNKVAGQNVEITVNGGQTDTIFGGGNSADVRSTLVTVNCELAAAAAGTQFGNVFSDAIISCTGESPDFSLKIKDENDYKWEGKGIYNIRTLFGGNNRANMEGVPGLDLASGSIGTVYGGGNAGDMTAQATDDCTSAHANLNINGNNVKYSTHVKTDSPYILMDYLYGGCQMSNVAYSTWVEVDGGHVGTVYGGCNISGDVGSTRVFPNAPDFVDGMPNPNYQKVYGAPYVVASGGTVYKNVFAGSNGLYHCKDSEGIYYIPGINYDPDHSYVGLTVPTHNETYVIIKGDVLVKGNVYAGGNMASVGFPEVYGVFPRLVGLASVHMSGGTVDGNVFGGGNMASIHGSNEIQVSGGSIGVRLGGALYGGNDRLGKAGITSNRVLPPSYNTASDGYTSLNPGGEESKVKTYLSVTGKPTIHTVYGGGNGAYTYTGPGADMEYCDVDDLPIQSNIFVDIAIDGGENGGHITNVYGGGNGVEALNFAKVFINVQNCTNDTYDHVDTIYGGNNMGDLSFLPDIILLKGNVHTVYGGCNKGAMTGNHTVDTYQNIGSFVRLRDTYPQAEGDFHPTAKVTGAVYGGCRSNGVTNNSLVLVEGGTHPASFFGGSDISGDVEGTSRVVVTGGIVGDVYGGGNGNYSYTGALADLTAPTSANSQVDILGGQVGTSGNNGGRNIFGGGLGAGTQTTGDVAVNIGPATASSWTGLPVIYGDVYGGSALGSVNTGSSNTTTVNFLNGTLHGNVFGGGLGDSEDNTKGWTKGVVTVNISKEDQAADKCFIDLREASVFGCNNTNGSPQDNVTVNVYKTAYNFGDYQTGDKYKASYSGNDASYAINQVFGGGNEADYAPENGSNSSAKKATVNIFDCNNTVRQVFGGGNAAAAIDVATNVYGGRFDQVFGGGNGSGGAANIGSGGTNLMVSGGIIRQLFGGCNLNGTIAGDMRVNVTNSGNCAENITEFFGGSNQAPIGTPEHPADLITNIGCNTEHPVNITDIYGGSNLASITGNVTLNINGGNFTNVFAGSKGVADGTAANITGNTVLNLYGGTIDKAFGGSNANGNITGTIQVNVEDTGDCPLQINTVYGGGNLAAYTPTYTIAPGEERISPEVNIKHAIVNDAVYGGGLGASAVVTANPIVTIGDNTSGHRVIVGSMLNGTSTQGKGNVFGGGDAAAVNGSTLVVYDDQNTASQVNRLFGGGNEAGVSSVTVNMNNGKVLTGIYGGCNTQGTVGGDIEVNIKGGTLGVEGTPMTSGIFGGGFGQPTQTSGNVVLNVGDGTHAPTIWADVYGGSALGKVNTQGTTTQKTTVYFANGNLHGDLYGGGLGDSSNPAEVYGSVEVNIGKDKDNHTISDGRIYGSVFGANNVNGSPEGSVTVNVYSATLDSIFGGGNKANYTPTDASSSYPELNIYNGNITHKVVGGGNAAGVTANPKINISGGTLCTSTNYNKLGIYGGCNMTGTVTGDITLTITGDATHTTTIGTEDGINGKHIVNVFGGGYGSGTSTTGDVTVNYGSDSNTECDYPKLYGDLYGGSALGSVNDAEADKTTVNIKNGSFGYFTEQVPGSGGSIVENQYGGSIYGGGLGQKAGVNGATSDIAALVNGEVHVNVGAGPGNNPTGLANLYHCSVYGGNNVNGSPQHDVYVDVYRTYHPTGTGVEDNDYAITNVFGGGNRADYRPVGSPNTTNTTGHKTHVYLHGCDNTVRYVYGGGNAAYAEGAITLIDGGHFDEVFGGGNGLITPADIGHGGICLQAFGGHVNFLYEGSNKLGANSGTPDQTYTIYTEPSNVPTGYVDCGDLFVDAFFFGDNEAEHIGDLISEITCEQSANYKYKYVYAGSRWAVIYGNVQLTVSGGTIENLFGGSRGYNDQTIISADIRKYPSAAEIQANPNHYSQAIKDFMVLHPDLAGQGGNVNLIINGGTVGNVFGGCDVKGNVEGKINVKVDNSGSTTCPLFVGNVYGASNLTEYTPTGTSNVDSPNVQIFNGTVGGSAVFQSGQQEFVGNVFGGGNEGKITSSPKVTVGYTDNTKSATVKGNVYGGGNVAEVEGNTKVLLQGNAEVKTNVYGGGKSADVKGSTNVILGDE